MSTTGIIFSPIYYQHNPGRGHPESARRLHAIVSELKKNKLRGVGNWQFFKPEKAGLEDVELVHDREYIEFIENTCSLGGGILDVEGDTVASRKSFEVALYAVGGTLKAVNMIMKGRIRNAFALVRPPGHHAGKYRACGFCFFNNVAVAAKHLLKIFKLKKILILDIDAHHGNGTQEIFYDTNEVLYMSLHEDPRGFPGKGFTGEVGEREGLGYNVNVPLPFQTTDEVYLKAINEIVKPIVRQYKPQFILVSAGLDAHYRDPVGNLCVSALCYQEVYETVVSLASEVCEGKHALVLEGGYSLGSIGKIAVAAIAKMSAVQYIVADNIPETKERVRRQGESVIEVVKQVQKDFWNI